MATRQELRRAAQALFKDAGLIGDMASNGSRFLKGLTGTAAGALGTAAGGITHGGQRAWNAVAPQKMQIDPAEVHASGQFTQNAAQLAGAGIKDMGTSLGAPLANTVNPRWAGDFDPHFSYRDQVLDAARNSPGVDPQVARASRFAQHGGDIAMAAATGLQGANAAAATPYLGAVPGMQSAAAFGQQPAMQGAAAVSGGLASSVANSAALGGVVDHFDPAKQQQQQDLGSQPQFFPDPTQVPPHEAIAMVNQLPPEQQPHAAREFVEGQVSARIGSHPTPEAEAKAKAELAARTAAGRNTPQEISAGLQTSAHEQGVDPTQPGILEQLYGHFQKLPPEQKMLLTLGVPLALAGMAAGTFGDDWLLGTILGVGGLAMGAAGLGMFGNLGSQPQTPAATSLPPSSPGGSAAPETTSPAPAAPAASPAGAQPLPDWVQSLTEQHPILQQYAQGGQDATLEPDDVRRMLTDYSSFSRGSAMKPELQAVIRDMSPEQRQQFRSQVMQGAGNQAGGANWLLGTLGI